MLEQDEGSAHSSESESESVEVPGEGTPPSVGSKEDKVEVPSEGNGKASDDKSPESEKEKPKPRASVLEYKSVSQVWDKDTYGRKLVDSLEDSSKKRDKYEEFIFVVRRQYDDRNMHYKIFIDIKSELLRDVLRETLKGIPTVSLHGDKPEIRVEVLFHFLSQIESKRDINILESDKLTQHLDLLIRFLQEHYASIIKTLPELLERGEMTFDLLWTLFPPNTVVYTSCVYSEEPKCLIFDFGEEKILKKGKFYILQCRYLDFNGKLLGEVISNLLIPEFRGAKPISALEAFPLDYHQDLAKVKSDLIERGRRFASLKGIHHTAYHGLAHQKRKGEPFKFSVKGRIMVDPIAFKEHNPNYERPRVDGLSGRDILGIRNDVLHDILTEGLGLTDDIKHGGDKNKSSEMKDEEFLVCGPTVLGFSLDRRAWAEFAVSGIQDITWTNLPFDTLVIPAKTKEMLQALVHNQIPDPNKPAFDDFIEGKGKGLIVLLHGPPGVGKTLTAEAVSEYQKRPLYRVCAGDLGLDSEKLEDRLAEILDLVARWKAILLLDEADVFLEARTQHHLQHNTLVSVFLRQLEYFQGVMILTTNRVTVFDEAVQSRIHLGIKYDQLSKRAKAEIWTAFILQANKVSTTGEGGKLSTKQLDDLSRREFNGRQIKNTVRMAHAFATAKGIPLGYDHLMAAIEANEDFDNDFRGAGQAASAASYL
ncbi:hypothetical protein IMSHALPRED_000298 [Imshaugia aleurites]|uniref:AAA+ ATPase domain-containing protein n=1 Tax=Imshaugia aleurites TaxID=172621 RepID=A0A8H3I9F5_9LECA|nr:hypothetical protein IMSHALPRED_000298 [Imshaugia aleurites]